MTAFNTVESSYIGTNATGTAAGSQAMSAGIYLTGANNTIGGMTAGAGNLISGNAGDGVDLSGSGTASNVIEGDLVGTNAAGTGAIPNAASGVYIEGTAGSNTIGGTSTLARDVISGNASYGVEIGTYGPVNTAGSVVEGDYIGVDVTGNVALGNSIGIYVVTASNNTIGGTAAGAGNVIAGNDGTGPFDAGSQVDLNLSSGTLVQANLIGLGADALALAGATGAGVLINHADGTTIGGVTAAARNVISGNDNGINDEYGSHNLIEGNYVGTDPTGTIAIGNANDVPSGDGIQLDNATNETIGGTSAGAGNLISGNTGGIWFYNPDSTGNLVEGNLIGTDKTGTVALGSGTGILDDVGGNTIGGLTSTPGTGPGNIVAGNTYGIGVGNFGNHSQTTTIIGNLIGAVALPGGGTSPANQYGILVESYSTFGNTDTQIGGTTTQDENVISGNTTDGIEINNAADVFVQGNMIGTDATGTVADANGSGIVITAASSSNTIGGTVAGAGNVISGNTTYGVEISGTGTSGNVVAGDHIGTDITGTAALANGTSGVEIDTGASGNTIGGSAAGARNVISGNSDGIDIVDSDSNVVVGNYVGTDVTGALALHNSNGVVLEKGASINTIGGTVAGLGNVISGNVFSGVKIIDYPTSGNVIEGDLIGTTATGDVALPNRFGVYINVGADGDLIGGAAAGAGDLISGNLIGIWIRADDDIVVEGDLIGTNINGTVALPNDVGVEIDLGGGNTIGGSISGDSNLISGNTYGISLNGPAGETIIAGNKIGTDITGTLALPNYWGVVTYDSSDNTIGGTVSGDSNLISGNIYYGISLNGTTTGMIVAGNKIGTDVTGTLAVPNGAGIEEYDASGNTIGGTVAGAGNLIAFNSGDAVEVVSGTGDPILENSIFGNGAGIVLTSGGNDDQANPVITDVTARSTETTISVDLTGSGFTPGSNYSLDFFASAVGDPTGGVEAHIYLGSETFTGGTTGTALFVLPSGPLTSSQTVTATATLLSGSTFTDTSTFASPVTVVVVAGSPSFTVTTTAATGAGSLEQAILYVDEDTGNSSVDTINFDIATGSGPYILNLPSFGLIAITHPVFLDGTSQPGYAGTPIIVLNGTGVRLGGLVLASGSDGSAVLGLDIIDFTEDAYGIDIESSGNVVQATYVGVQANGSIAASNFEGILIDGSNNTVGGATVGAGNLISGNVGDGIDIEGPFASGNLVAGNKIGTDITGTVALGNGGSGVVINTSASNTIGGTAAGAGNVISGNTTNGVAIYTSLLNFVQGNLIGTDLSGAAALGNTGAGVAVYGTSESYSRTGRNVIGGTTAGAGNVISGNGGGIFIDEGFLDLVAGNLIGTDAAGTAAVANEFFGISTQFGSGNTIGGTTAGAGNVVLGSPAIGIDDDQGDLVAGNKIGTDITGTVGVANGSGVGVDISGGASDNTIGGTGAAGNLISDNGWGVEFVGTGGTSNLVAGNLIGTDVTGTVALGNLLGGVLLASGSGNTIGGAAGLGNLISSNGYYYGPNGGIDIEGSTASGNLVLGNKIGTNITGTVALGNNENGVTIANGASSNTIGGTAAGDGNLISGNDVYEVEISARAHRKTSSWATRSAPTSPAPQDLAASMASRMASRSILAPRATRSGAPPPARAT